MARETKLAVKLRALRIFNEHGLLGRYAEPGKDVCVEYQPYVPGRMVSIAGARVWSPSHEVNPGGHWIDYGSKVFSGNRAEAMPKALAWASERYGITDWLPSPFGGASTKLPAIVVQRAKAAKPMPGPIT